MAEALFYAVLLGMAAGLFYDITRLFRYIFNDKFFFDFIFWVISSIAFFCYYLIFNSGEIRVVLLAAAAAGFLLYIFTLGYVTRPLEKKISRYFHLKANKLKARLKSLKKALQSRCHVYYNITEHIKRVFVKKSKGDGDG